MGEIARSSSLVAKMVRELPLPNPTRTLPADLLGKTTRLVDDAVRQYQGSLGASAAKREKAWIPPFLKIFRLLASRQMQEEHAGIESFRMAVRNDLRTTMLLSEHGFGLASGWHISPSWDQQLFETLLECSKQYEFQWLERQERIRSAVMPDSSEMFGDPLAQCKPRDVRTKDTYTARRIEQFRRRMEVQGTREVGTADMVDYLGYQGPGMLQRVSRETNASQSAIEAVDRMLKCPSSEEFWRVVHDRRKSKAMPK